MNTFLFSLLGNLAADSLKFGCKFAIQAIAQQVLQLQALQKEAERRQFAPPPQPVPAPEFRPGGPMPTR
jgi:hypothetical protein